MFLKAVIGTGLDEASDYIMRCMKGLRKMGTREVILVHALNIRDVGTLYDGLKMMALPKLGEQKKLLEGIGFNVKVEVPLGLPFNEINRISRENNASIVVVYSVAETLVGAALLGGIAYEVINRSEKPVMVLRAKIVEKKAIRRCEVICADFLKHVLYPTDFSDTAERAFAYVEKVVEQGCRKVMILHVQEKVRIEKYLKERLKEFNQIDRARMERLKKRLIQKGARNVGIEIPYGHAASEILKRAKSGSYSLIIMGNQGRGFISEMFLGSVSHNVARHAPVPVLLIPTQR